MDPVDPSEGESPGRSFSTGPENSALPWIGSASEDFY